jgi:hypothetical protein
MNLTEREKLVLLAVLSYAYSNTDDLNHALEHDADHDLAHDHIKVGETITDPVTEDEIDRLMLKLPE